MNKFKELTLWFYVAWKIMTGGCIFFTIIYVALDDYHYLSLALVCSLVSLSIAFMEKGIKTLH